jgi:hypothetical protein
MNKNKFINSSQNEGLSPSCIALSFNRFGSISWHSICFFFSALVHFWRFFLFSHFQLFRAGYHWKDLSSRNAHLVHQNWYRISFTFLLLCPFDIFWGTENKYISLTVVSNGNWQIHYMTNVMSLILQYSAFLLYIIIYCFYLLKVCIFPS